MTSSYPNDGSHAGGTLLTINGAGFLRGGVEGTTSVLLCGQQSVRAFVEAEEHPHGAASTCQNRVLSWMTRV